MFGHCAVLMVGDRRMEEDERVAGDVESFRALNGAMGWRLPHVDEFYF